MSTRGLYTFVGENASDTWNVYRHHDNYPTGAADAIKAALSYAWELPRYEADEFATAFIAANKPSLKKDLPRGLSGGSIRMMPQGEPATVAQTNCSDIEFRYVITHSISDPSTVYVTCYDTDGGEKESKVFEGTLPKFAAWAKKAEAA